MEHLLLAPIEIGPMTVPNRIVMPAMHLNYTMGGDVTDQLIAFYRARALGGAGLIIVGGCAIDEVGGGFFLIGMHHDRFIPGLTRFVARWGMGRRPAWPRSSTTAVATRSRGSSRRSPSRHRRSARPTTPRCRAR
jgi:2,4-dienoyl-CoA reductase-like NADH-dependent reductase (Old Yellow Enzyme family)